MANIYLKVPTYIAQFYLGRVAPQPALSEFTPIAFSPFQQEHMIMSSALLHVNECDMEHTMCFSERMWKNILNGKKPQGGKVVLKRDPQQWPTIDEINYLTDVKKNKKTDGFDFLCIEAPKVITEGPNYKQVLPSFTLPFSPANNMVRQLRKEFLHILLYWITEELFVCARRGIHRDATMCIDHFFSHYQMCLGTNSNDRDSMRRMAMRWIEEAKMLPIGIDDEDSLFVYEREEEQGGLDIDALLANVKSSINKQ